MNTKQFNEKLVNVFAVANKDITKRLDFNFSDGTLYFTIRSKKEGSVNCINAAILALKPADEPHCIKLSEVWVGYDQEGSCWSDSMGGKIIDCTGLKVGSAIDLIVSELNARVKEFA